MPPSTTHGDRNQSVKNVRKECDDRGNVQTTVKIRARVSREIGLKYSLRTGPCDCLSSNHARYSISEMILFWAKPLKVSGSFNNRFNNRYRSSWILKISPCNETRPSKLICRRVRDSEPMLEMLSCEQSHRWQSFETEHKKRGGHELVSHAS